MRRLKRSGDTTHSSTSMSVRSRGYNSCSLTRNGCPRKSFQKPCCGIRICPSFSRTSRTLSQLFNKKSTHLHHHVTTAINEINPFSDVRFMYDLLKKSGENTPFDQGESQPDSLVPRSGNRRHPSTQYGNLRVSQRTAHTRRKATHSSRRTRQQDKPQAEAAFFTLKRYV